MESAFGDLDGDGYPELVWYVCKSGESIMWFFIHRWKKWDQEEKRWLPIAINEEPIKYAYDLAYQNHWQMYARNTYSTALGKFSHTYAAPDTQNVRMQIALIQNARTGNDMQWGIFGFDPAANWPFITLGEGKLQGLKNNNVIPVIAAADIDEESMILGQPTSITMEDVVETFLVIQAPPRHWDMVNTGKDDMPVDAFFNLERYGTQAGISGSTSTMSTTTDISGGKFGVGLEASYTYTIPKIFQGSIRIGGHYAHEAAHKHEEGKSRMVTTKLSTTADYDDQIYSRTSKHTIWRYPILYPESESIVKVPDDKDPTKTVDGRAFFQIVVPEEIGDILLPANGRNLGWYRPTHDNFNLFTYPVKIEQVSGYPGSAPRVVVPGKDIKGVEFLRQQDVLIGNPGRASATVEISQSSHVTKAKSLKQTLGADVNTSAVIGSMKVGPSVGFKVNLDYDHTWANDSSTTTNASNTAGITIDWKGARDYKSKSGFTPPLTPEEQAFHSDIAIYAQTDGRLCASYTVGKLRNEESRLWGKQGSPYYTPDPGLALPHKWSSNGSANTNRNSRFIRGLWFVKGSGTTSASVGQYSRGLDSMLLETAADYTAILRVFNMSFVDSGPVTVNLYWQKIDKMNDEPDISKAKPLASTYISRIYGRDSGSPEAYNWTDEKLTFTTPSNPEAVWLHVKITYKGKDGELSTHNNYGYMLVGVENPVVRFAERTSASSVSVSAGAPDIGIRDLKVRRYNDDGTLGDLSADNIPRDKKLHITGRLFLNGEFLADGSMIAQLPTVRVALLGGTRSGNVWAVLAGDEVPLMLSKGAYAFSFNYDPKLHRDAKVLKVQVFSPAMSSANDRDISNNTVTIWDDTGKP